MIKIFKISGAGCFVRPSWCPNSPGRSWHHACNHPGYRCNRRQDMAPTLFPGREPALPAGLHRPLADHPLVSPPLDWLFLWLYLTVFSYSFHYTDYQCFCKATIRQVAIEEFAGCADCFYRTTAGTRISSITVLAF